MIGYCAYYKQTALTEAECSWCAMPWGCVYWRDKEPRWCARCGKEIPEGLKCNCAKEKKFKCVHCGRTFKYKNIIHRCKGTLRKRRLHFIEIEKEENEE